MKPIFIYISIIAYYIISSLLCYKYLSDSTIYSLLFPILLPLTIMLAVGIILLFFIGIIAGLQYLNRLFISNTIYLTIKPIFALIFFFLIYCGFTFITSKFFFENPHVICPIDTHYYHWDMECDNLPYDYYPIEEEECSILTALLEGRKGCNRCSDYISDIEALKNTLKSFCIFYLLMALAEFLYKENLFPFNKININIKT